MIDVRRRDLGALDPIGSDAFTRRYAVGNRLGGLPQPLWYREIRPDHELPVGVTPEDVRGAFVQAVTLRDRCSQPDRAELDRRTDWSLAVVRGAVQGGGITGADTVVGVLLPGLPDDFIVPSPTHPGVGAGSVAGVGFAATGRRALTLRDLCASDEAVAANNVDRSAVDDDLIRLTLAAQLARTIHLLHRNRIAYSDLSLGSVAIAGHPPRTLLIGCDPTVPLVGPADRSTGQPRIGDLDTSRLALCLIRALAQGPGATQLTDPARVGGLLGEPGVGLLARALGRPPARPPSAERISAYLTGRLAELARETGLADRDATLPGLDIAAQLRGLLPRLAVPDLPAVAAPRPPALLPQRPTAAADVPAPPRIELPPLELDRTAIGADALAKAPTQSGGAIARAYLDASQQIGEALRDGLRTLHAAIGERLPRGRPGPDLPTERPGRT